MANMDGNTTALMEDTDFIIIVHGVIPEAMPPVAYRRTGRTVLADRKAIKCPYCSAVLTTVDRHTRVQLFRSPKNRENAPIAGQIFKHCEVCKHEVGIVMA